MHTCFNSSKMTNCWETKCVHHNFQTTSIALTQYKRDVVEILQSKPTLVLSSQYPHLAYFLSNSFLTEKIFILWLCWNHTASRVCCQGTATNEEVETSFWFHLAASDLSNCHWWLQMDGEQALYTGIRLKLFSNPWYYPAWRHLSSDITQSSEEHNNRTLRNSYLKVFSCCCCFNVFSDILNSVYQESKVKKPVALIRGIVFFAKEQASGSTK